MERLQPTHVLAHLSDTHVTGDGSLIGGVVDARARLLEALGVLTRWNVGCDAWVFSGDLTDTGAPEAYRWLRSTVEEAAASVGVPVIWANGNHDDLPTFRAEMLGAPGSEPYLAEHDVNGLRVLVLDSAVAGTPAGRLGEEALGWLAERLSTPAEEGTVVVMHHPPLPPLQVPAWEWPLTNAEALAPVLEGSDVRAILSGHYHHAAFGVFAGVGVSVAPSLVYTQDVTVGRDLRGQDANVGFSVVEVFDHLVTHTVVPLGRGAGVHEHLPAR